MDPFIFIVLFILGLLVGSFLNVVILRWNTGMPIGNGRSECFSCAKQLSWYELVPIASFIFLRGRCSQCSTKISWQYPAVELSGGLAFILAYISSEPFLLLAPLFCLYIAITVYDLRHQIIPDAFSYAASAIALCLIGWQWYATGIINTNRLIAGPALFAFFAFFWLVSRGKWMGFGDAKLALSVGFVLGLSQGIAAILLAFWIGAAVSIALIVIQKLLRSAGTLGMKSAVPFGPFILLGFFVSYIFHIGMGNIFSFLAL
jgi:leader peptidase (prepilin peptidase) / N-methyltransferase